MRILWWLPRIFAAIGAAMLVLSAWLYQRERAFVAHATHTTGTVVELRYEANSDGGGTYHPVFQFQDAQGQSYTVRSNTGTKPPSHHVGESVEVLYDPAAPANASMSGYFNLYLGSFITAIFALVWGSIGGVWMWLVHRAAALAEELRHSGQRIQAKVVGIEQRRNIRVGTKHPFRIIAEGQQGSGVGAGATFRSANIWFDPTPFVGETVNVFVDRNDPSRHVVDLDFLSDKAARQ